MLLAALQASFNGVAAVIVFFLISGLCIHLPYQGQEKLPLTGFYVRRFLRVGIPLLSVQFVTALLGPKYEGALAAVTWSVFAELFYYAIYPALFLVAVQVRWPLMIAVTSLVSIAISLDFASQTHLPPLGWYVWIWGLPIWLCGCQLAEWIRSGQAVQLPGSLNAWRFAAWAFSVGATFLVFHGPLRIGSQFSMLVFTPIALVWLTKELTSRGRIWQWLERCGQASYSLYLVHPIVLSGDWLASLSRQPLVALTVPCLAIGLATLAFYAVVERPAHHLARRAARLFAPPMRARANTG